MADLYDDPAALASDRDQIQALKARYFRFIDTKDWDGFRDLFTDDLRFYRDAAAVPTTTEPVTTSRDQFVDRIRTWLATAVTVHQGHMAEIDLESPSTARGVWAMFDWVDNPQFDKAYQGYGHYHERYRKGDDGRWRIAELRLTRLRIVHLDTTPKDEVDRAKQEWLER